MKSRDGLTSFLLIDKMGGVVEYLLSITSTEKHFSKFGQKSKHFR